MSLVHQRPRRLLAASLASCLALVSSGPSVAIACEGGGEEEKPQKVLTVEKAGGPEAVVGDAVKVALETGTKSQFINSEGEIACGKSEAAGKVESNPVKGAGKGEIKLESFTFGTCTTTIAGLTVKNVAIETLPLIAKTVGTTEFEISEEGAKNVGVTFTIERGGEEQICVYRTTLLKAPYRNNSEGELEISEKLGGFKNELNCAPKLTEPTWKAKYRPLRDETGGRAGKQIFIN
jgi:hypothetical protein